jgi:hypothetical protein
VSLTILKFSCGFHVIHSKINLLELYSRSIRESNTYVLLPVWTYLFLFDLQGKAIHYIIRTRSLPHVVYQPIDIEHYSEQLNVLRLTHPSFRWDMA